MANEEKIDITEYSNDENKFEINEITNEIQKNFDDYSHEQPQSPQPNEEIEINKLKNNKLKKNKNGNESERLRIIAEMSKFREERKKIAEEGDANYFEEIDDEAIETASVRSFSTATSTIAPSVVKIRTRKELQYRNKKQFSKKNLRVKGEANAFNREKKKNVEEIKDMRDCYY